MIPKTPLGYAILAATVAGVVGVAVLVIRQLRTAPEEVDWACPHRQYKPWYDGSPCPECPPGKGFNAPSKELEESEVENG